MLPGRTSASLSSDFVPLVLDAIKAELNRELRPGRYVLTGSTRYSSLPLAAQSLTGRMHVVTVWPLSQGELAGTRETFVEQLLDEPAALVTAAPSGTSRGEYVERVLHGGLPLAVRRAGVASRTGGSTTTAAITELGHLLETFRVLGGVVLHAGPRAYTCEERLHALPIDRLWEA